AVTPPAGTFGAVRFRTTALPVVALITDISWHDAGNSPYGPEVTTSVPLSALKAKFVQTNARFVNITQPGEEAQADALSDATQSNIPVSAFKGACGAGMCCPGLNGAGRAPSGPGGTCRLNFLHQSGDGVSTGIANAVAGLASGSKFDVSLV